MSKPSCLSRVACSIVVVALAACDEVPNDFDPRELDEGDAGTAVDPIEPDIVTPLQPDHHDAGAHADAADASHAPDGGSDVDAGPAKDASSQGADARVSEDASTVDASAPIVDASTPGASFASVYSVMMTSCTGCHGAGKTLDLSTPELAHAGLVGAAAAYPACSGDAGSYVRVVAGDADGSLLIAKLEGTQTCGKQMPPRALLSADEIALFRSWIAAGAPAN
jgi:hypothetical protein